MNYLGKPEWIGYDGVNTLMKTTHSDLREEDEVVVAYFHKYRPLAGKRAAYLRISGIKSEVRQVCQKCKGGASFFHGGHVLYQVTCPSDDCEKAKFLLAEFDSLSCKDNERIVEEFRLNRGANPVYFLGFPVNYHAWKTLLSSERSVDARVGAICAWLVGGEVWDRYRKMMIESFDKFNSISGGRIGASGYFTEDYSELTSECPWTQNGIQQVNILLDAMEDQEQAKVFKQKLPLVED